MSRAKDPAVQSAAVNHHKALDLAESAKHGTIAVVDVTGRVDLVPITYAIDSSQLVTADGIDRLENLRKHPETAVLITNYANDWSKRWWVRVRGICRFFDGGDAYAEAVEMLQEKYPQYKKKPPKGPIIRLDITEITGAAG